MPRSRSSPSRRRSRRRRHRRSSGRGSGCSVARQRSSAAATVSVPAGPYILANSESKTAAGRTATNTAAHSPEASPATRRASAATSGNQGDAGQGGHQPQRPRGGGELGRRPGEQVEERRCAVTADHVEHPVQRAVENDRREVLVVAERLAGQEGEAEQGARGRDQGQRSAVSQAVPQDGQPRAHGDTAQTAGVPEGSHATGLARPATSDPRALARSSWLEATTVEYLPGFSILVPGGKNAG